MKKATPQQLRQLLVASGGEWPKTDKDTLSNVRWVARYLMFMRKLSINDKQIILGGHLMCTPGWWNVNSLSDATGYSRPSIKEALDDALIIGTIEQNQRKQYRLTQYGMAFCLVFTRAAIAYASRRTSDPPEELLEMIEGIPQQGVKRPIKANLS